MTDEIRLVFVGAPLLDICAKCDKNTLKKFGLKRDDGIKASKEHEELIQQLFNDSNSELSAGGSAQNSARIAKWILGSKSRVSFIGCTGNDSFERWLKEKLILDGVAPLYVQSPDLKTGICACLIIDESERSMICQHEASATLRAEHLEIEDIKHDLAKADIIFVEGYFIAHSPDVVLALAKMKTSKQVFSLSLSAEYICKDYSDILLKVLPRVDILFGNEVELKALATALGAPLSITVEEALRKTRGQTNNSPKTTIITRGSEPVIVDNGSAHFRTFSVDNSITMVDGVGCGDAVAGACLAVYGLTKNLDLSVETGIKAASEIAQVKGCTLPSFKIFDPELRKHNS
ncbi:adenosine kinase isoform X3 [Parasteatoda tepidariorum]|uniref:adenosine kinase isoform X3 n=1 Tax=Parasteatoda tepidariorum TaxID=114398 RepID=UPI0039BD1956